jgi:hypothetical protein
MVPVTRSTNRFVHVVMAKANGTPFAGGRHPLQRPLHPPQRLIEEKVAGQFMRQA